VNFQLEISGLQQQGTSCLSNDGMDGSGFSLKQQTPEILLILLQCDRTCGKGLQRRKVVCRARSRSVVTENACPHPKPDKVQQCILPECEGKLCWLAP